MEFCRGTEGTRTSFHIPMRPSTTSPQLCRNPFARSSPEPCIRSSRIWSSILRPQHLSTPNYNIRVGKFRECTGKVRRYYGHRYKDTAVVRALPGDSSRVGEEAQHYQAIKMNVCNATLPTLARPKSVRQICPFAPNRRFSGLRSLPENEHVSILSRSNRWFIPCTRFSPRL